MARRRARELVADPRHAPTYRPPDLTGRVRADVVWQRALDRAARDGSARVTVRR